MRAAGNRRHPIRLMLVVREPLLLDLLVRAMSGLDGVEVVGAAGGGDSAVELANEHRPDVVLIESQAADGGEALAAGRQIKSDRPDVAVLLVAGHAEASRLQRLVFSEGPGWSYFLRESLHSVEDLENAIRSASTGLTTIDKAFVPDAATGTSSPIARLTPGQRRVLELVAAGLSNDAIADQLSISSRTVEYHLNEVYRRLACGDPREVNMRVRAAMTFRSYDGEAPSLPNDPARQGWNAAAALPSGAR